MLAKLKFNGLVAGFDNSYYIFVSLKTALGNGVEF